MTDGAVQPILYTAIFGSKDNLIEDHEGIDGWRFVCFTDDRKMQSSRAEIIQVPMVSTDPTRSARFLKLLPHLHLPAAPYSVWIDGTVRITTTDFSAFVEQWLAEAPIGSLQHQQRDCVYREGAAVIERGKDDRKIVTAQLKEYERIGFPHHYGLHFTKVVARRHNDPQVQDFSERWWDLLLNYSKRDQLSFDVARWMTGADVATRSLSPVPDENFFVSTGHLVADPPVLRRSRGGSRSKRDPFGNASAALAFPPPDQRAPARVPSHCDEWSRHHLLHARVPGRPWAARFSSVPAHIEENAALLPSAKKVQCARTYGNKPTTAQLDLEAPR